MTLDKFVLTAALIFNGNCLLAHRPAIMPSADWLLLVASTGENLSAPAGNGEPPGDSQVTATHFELEIRNARILRAKAKQRGDRAGQAEGALQEARAIELWIAADPAQKTRLPEAVNAYQSAFAFGTGKQRAIAANNLSVLLLRRGDLSGALEAFRKIDLRFVKAEDVYLHQYNYARILQLNQHTEEAYTHYVDAVKLRPDFVPAVDGAFLILRRQKPFPVSDAAKLSEILVRGGRPDLVRSRLEASAALWSAEPNAGELLAELVRSYSALAISPLTFGDDDLPLLMEALGASPLRFGIEELRSAYSGTVPSQGFTYWKSTNDSGIFAELLKTIGDFYSARDDYPVAVTLYSEAWDMGNSPDPALYMAALIRGHPELDPNWRLFQKLVESVDAKSNTDLREDQQKMLRLRAVMATIFFDDHRQFENGRQPHSMGDPWGAISEWERARKIADKDQTLPPVPNLYLHLGNCYGQVGRVRDMQDNYLSAAEGFAKVSDLGEARYVLRKLHQGDLSYLNQEQQAKLRAIERKVNFKTSSQSPELPRSTLQTGPNNGPIPYYPERAPTTSQTDHTSGLVDHTG